ncbi:hypothetical protein PR048_009916 [Dryococelus australis]|uniref:Uncharacterized protein n=1 Tax=Dryococelus australis TaxID=614101 RepID=A0ABQ9I350_9NEOP|nr:hypothetical protein PR048_009916 [Dryococelus australis]
MSYLEEEHKKKVNKTTFRKLLMNWLNRQKKTENINLIIQSNSFRKTAKEKLVELQKLEKKIHEISEKMKK